MELDKLQETDEEIPWALNCLSFRIFSLSAVYTGQNSVYKPFST